VKKERKTQQHIWKIIAIALVALQLIEVLYVGISLGYPQRWFYRYPTAEEAQQTLPVSEFGILPKPEDWRQIVQDSPYHLPSATATYDESNGEWWVKIVNMSYDYPVIDGSTVMMPLAMEFARQLLGVNDNEAGQFIDFSGTHKAYENLFQCGVRPSHAQTVFMQELHEWQLNCVGAYGTVVDLVLGVAPSQEELALNETLIEPIIKPICKDAFVFIIHRDNPVESLTVEQVRGIYEGRIKNWKELGGPDLAIEPYQRNENSGSQTGMKELVMQDRRMIKPIRRLRLESMSSMVDVVAAEYTNGPAAIGYTYRYYIENQYQNENIKMLRIEGAAPTDENVISGAYPLVTEYVGVVREAGHENQAPPMVFLDWILSEEGQACVKQAGYIPLEATP